MFKIFSVKSVVCLQLILLLFIGLIRSVNADQLAPLSVEEFKRQFIEPQVELLPQDFSKKINDPAKFNSSKAIEAYEKFEKPDFDMNVYKVMAYNYFLERNFKEADKIFENLKSKVTTENDKFWTYYNWGITLLSKGYNFRGSDKYEDFEKWVKKGVERGYNVSFLLHADFTHASIQLKKATEFNPNYIEAYYYQGVADIATGNYASAIDMFRKTVQLNPNYEDAYSQWGLTLSKQGKFKEAIEKYQKALEINPQNSINNSNWGAALSRLGRYEEAIEKYQKAVEADPSNTLVYSNWGDALANLDKYDQASEKCMKSIQLNPDNPDAYYILARVHTKLNLKQEALTYLQKACELNQQLKQIARNDKDFKKIWGDPEFRKITKP